MTNGPIGTVRLLAQLDRMEDEGALDVNHVDFTVHHPHEMRLRLAPALDAFARVELEVERNIREVAALLPHQDEQTQRFVRVWSEQEIPHGVVFERLLAQLELPPANPDLTSVNPALRVLGRLSSVPGVQDVLMFIYLSIGAMHERLTATGYDLLRDRMEEIGEHGIVTTALRPIRAQESGHYAYYRNAALITRERLSAWQLHLARMVRTRTYHPIGATTPSNTAAFARTAVLLTGTTDLDEFAIPVQRLAQQLLVRQDDGLVLPPFVRGALSDAVDSIRPETSELLRRAAGHDPSRPSGTGRARATTDGSRIAAISGR